MPRDEPRSDAGLQFAPGAFEGLNVRNNPFERANLVFANTLRLDPDAAIRSLFNPNSLPPSQRRTLADQWGVGRGFVGTLLRTISDPLVLIGAVLSLKYPVPRADRLFKFAPKLSGLNRNPGILRLGITGNIDAILGDLKVGGKEVAEVYKGVLRDVHNYDTNFLMKMGLSVERFERNSGARLTPEMETALSMAVQGPAETFGLRVKNMGPAWDQLIKDYHTHKNEMFRLVFAKADKGALLQALQLNKVSSKQFQQLVARRSAGAASAEERQLIKKVMGSRANLRRSIAQQLESVGIPSDRVFNVKFIPKYFPHMLPLRRDPLETQYGKLVKATLSEKQSGPAFVAAAGKVSTPRALPRHGGMAPEVESLKRAKQFFENPEKIRDIELEFQRNSNLKPYSTQFLDVYENYVHSTGRAWAWTVRGGGPQLVEAVRVLENDPRPFNQIKAGLLRDSFIPAALGRLTPRQVRASLHFDSIKISLAEKLESPVLEKMLGKELIGRLTDSLRQDRGPFAFRKFQGRASNLFYAGGLGLNGVSATWNLFQTLLTTVPTIGLGATLKGLKNTLGRSKTYFSQRLQGLTHESAIAKAFPDFVGEGLTASPLTADALASSLSGAWDRARSVNPNWKRTGHMINQAMMSFFQASETMVRLTAFEGTLAKGLQEGLTRKAASTAARRVTELTQFLSGPASTPVALQGLGPLLRQFGTFPLRFADWLIGTSTELGSAAQRGGFLGVAKDRNLGTLGRALLTSGVAYEAATGVGQDVSDALLFGALPGSSDPNRPFFPLPFVPPILSIAGSAASDIIRGEFKSLPKSLPVAVPGGVALSRFAGMVPPVAKFLGKPFVDYKNRLSDGRYRLLTPNGQVIGAATPTQIWLGAFRPFGAQIPSMVQEQELIGYFSSQSQRISGIRRQYLEALYLRNDVDKADSLNREYKRLYPGIGDIQIRPEHVQALQRRQDTTRLERVFFSLPPEVRPMLGQVLAESAVRDLPKFLGIDPGLLRGSGVTPTDLEPFRRPPPQSIQQAFLQKAQDAQQVLPGVGLLTGPRLLPGLSGGLNPQNPQKTPFSGFGF